MAPKHSALEACGVDCRSLLGIDPERTHVQVLWCRQWHPRLAAVARLHDAAPECASVEGGRVMRIYRDCADASQRKADGGLPGFSTIDRFENSAREIGLRRRSHDRFDADVYLRGPRRVDRDAPDANRPEPFAARAKSLVLCVPAVSCVGALEKTSSFSARIDDSRVGWIDSDENHGPVCQAFVERCPRRSVVLAAKHTVLRSRVNGGGRVWINSESPDRSTGRARCPPLGSGTNRSKEDHQECRNCVPLNSCQKH